MIIGFILAVALDAHSTCYALSNGRREVLLPFKTCTTLTVYQGLAASSVIAYSYGIKKHKKLRRFILISGIAVHSFAAAYNYRQTYKGIRKH